MSGKGKVSQFPLQTVFVNCVKKLFATDARLLTVLLVIFLLGFGIRAQNIQDRYEYFFGFDSYFHARITSYVIQQGTVPEIDPIGYYECSVHLEPFETIHWYVGALLYKLFTFGAPYDKERWIFFVKLLPALYGAIAALLMFFFGRYVYGRKAGIAMALVAATVPAYVYRTMAGFFEEDSLGFVWMVAGLALFAYATREPGIQRNKLVASVLAGAMFALMAWTWDLYLLAPLVLMLYFPFAVAIVYAKFDVVRVREFIVCFAATFGSFAPLSYPVRGVHWATQSLSYVQSVAANFVPPDKLVFVGFFLIILAVFVALVVFGSPLKSRRRVLLGLVIAALYLGAGALAVVVGTVPAETFIPKDLGKLVGEESPGIGTFGYKYNIFIVFPVLALILIPYFRVFKHKYDHLSVLIFFWIMVTLFMAYFKLKFTYTFGLPIAAATGSVVAITFAVFRNREEFSTKLVALVLGVLLLAGIAGSAIFVVNRPPSIETGQSTWKDVFVWVKENTPKDAKFFIWWSWGHWFAFLAERKVSSDNRNAEVCVAPTGEKFMPNKDYASFVLATDLNEALSIIKKYDADYVVLDADLLRSPHSMFFYKYRDPDYKFSQQELEGLFACWYAPDRNVFVCNTRQMLPTAPGTPAEHWSATPNSVIAGQLAGWLYTDDDGTQYLLAHGINSMMVARLWFRDPEAMKYFEQVYHKGDIKLFKVKKDTLPA